MEFFRVPVDPQFKKWISLDERAAWCKPLIAGILLFLTLLSFPCYAQSPAAALLFADIPDTTLASAYQQAAHKNVLAAVNPQVFPGYFSVCADGQGFGYGNSYPSLDGHQLSDALLFLGQVDVVKENWKYVRSFQKANGLLPLAILPAMAGKEIGVGRALARVAENGGLYEHWVPGNPLAALADPTFIQNADVIFRYTLDRNWLSEQIPFINRSADHLLSLTTAAGAVQGAGYYIERPTRIESDGVAQCYAVDAFRRVADLNRVLGDTSAARKYGQVAQRIQRHFQTRFWVGDHFAEYLHPQRGVIASHGLTDVDWAAIATNVATAEQKAVLWPQLCHEKRFHYGGMPTGIATEPQSYEDWEFTHPDRHDLAAMGRVWYLEAWARAVMGDGQGLLAGLLKVSQVGRDSSYYWFERYHPDGADGVKAAGPKTYCEYPANLIRIVQRFLFGVERQLDGTLVLAPVVTAAFWQQGFGQTLQWRERTLTYHMQRNRISGIYRGAAPQRLAVKPAEPLENLEVRVFIDGQPVPYLKQDGLLFLSLPPAPANPGRFEMNLISR